MRKKYLEFLVDPVTDESLELTSFHEKQGHVMAGILISKSNWYPVINGIPRMLVEELKLNLLQQHHDFLNEWKHELPKSVVKEWDKVVSQIEDLDAFVKHQKKTAESFSYEWDVIYRENDYEKHNFLHFLSPFIKEKDLKDKLVVDIGCGSGRFTKQASLCGAKIVFGTDLGETVEVAFRMTKDLPNTCIVQADIYHMPFRKKFDVAMSIGVLHHLPEPKSGFLSLPKVLKRGGKMLIWVYNRRNNARALYFYEPVRAVAKKLPKPLLYKLCYVPGGAVHLINYSTHALNLLGAKKLAKKMPFAYYANFSFNMKLNDAFDVLATPKSNYYFVEEIETWFKDAKLKDIRSYEHPEAGITCVGRHEA